jgi:predicted RNA-binding Zn-ribbon protein involved in translation (DUF1610 family)
MERKDQILNKIKEQKDSLQSKSYEYKCLRCGLVLTFNRNQPNIRCPNDGNTMYRQF